MEWRKSPYELLRSRDIIAILDGDTSFGAYEVCKGKSIDVRMPYLNGQSLCDISNKFGLPVKYVWGGSNLSRWQYLDNLMEHCINNGKFSTLLAYLFDKSQFAGVLSDCTVNEINAAYDYITSTVIQKINGILYFSGKELTVIGKKFAVRPIGSHIEIDAPKIKTIDRDYIRSISDRAMEDVEHHNFDSAITKSRTLLEEVFIYVIEKKNEEPSESGDMMKLFKQVKDLYNMHTDKDTDRRINTLLSGLNSIINAISEMRNKDSDAHGAGAKRIAIKEYHARLFVNSANTMADFILSVEQNASSKSE